MSNNRHIVGVQFSTFTRAVQFLCEELALEYSLGADYQGIHYGMRTTELKSLNPFGKVPVLIEGDKILYESVAICRYLDNQYNQSQLQLHNTWMRAQVDQWCAVIAQYVDKAIVRDFLLEYRFPKGENGSVRMDVVAAAIPNILEVVALLEQQLDENNYLVANQFSLADILLTPMLHYLLQVPNNDKLVASTSVLRSYLARILERPSAQKVFS